MDLDGFQSDESIETPLYIDHFFGGFVILLVGLIFSVVIFVTERSYSVKDGIRFPFKRIRTRHPRDTASHEDYINDLVAMG